MSVLRFRAWDLEHKVLIEAHEDLWLALDGEVWEKGFDDCPPERTTQFLIEQSTGLHDKNGVEIYEGDILAHFEMRGVQFTMEWEQRTAQFTPYSPHDCYEVIGNIHESPELLVES